MKENKSSLSVTIFPEDKMKANSGSGTFLGYQYLRQRERVQGQSCVHSSRTARTI